MHGSTDLNLLLPLAKKSYNSMTMTILLISLLFQKGNYINSTKKPLLIQNFSMHGSTDLNLLLLPLVKKPYNSMTMTILLNEFCIPALLFKLSIKKKKRKINPVNVGLLIHIYFFWLVKGIFDMLYLWEASYQMQNARAN